LEIHSGTIRLNVAQQNMGSTLIRFWANIMQGIEEGNLLTIESVNMIAYV